LPFENTSKNDPRSRLKSPGATGTEHVIESRRRTAKSRPIADVTTELHQVGGIEPIEDLAHRAKLSLSERSKVVLENPLSNPYPLRLAVHIGGTEVNSSEDPGIDDVFDGGRKAAEHARWL